ncbi:serine hydrolase domain-containing protein [Streptosporangium sp. NPDC051022]|uniref:serine hydrolase domain-containing protein n=1 Tax=Streptosporangium sp. NPDC051022 TaxID=3155752 RepID=UPI00343B3034
MLGDLQTRLDEVARAHEIPGAAIAVSVGDRLYEAATGVLNLETGVEVTPDSLFQVGSTTKVWTAALIMQLVEEGLVDLDRPVRAYLPEFAVADPDASEKVTVRQLLTHTGGFDGDLFPDTGRGDDSLPRYVELLREARQVDPPGTMFSYCNSGYVVLGAIVARLRGCTWEEAMRGHLFAPLGAERVALFPEEAVLGRASAGHMRPPGATGQVVVRPWGMTRGGAPAGATLCAAPRELVRFGRMTLRGGLAEDGTRVLSEASVRAMTSPQFPLSVFRWLGEDWGLGFVLLGWGGGVYGHDGGTPGQITNWWVVPGHDVVLAVTSNGGDSYGLLRDLAYPITRELTGLEAPMRPVPPAVPYPADVTPYVGRYAGPMFTCDVVAAEGGLEITQTPEGFFREMGQPVTTTRFVALDERTFVATEGRGTLYDAVTFITRDGVATHLFNGRATPRV